MKPRQEPAPLTREDYDIRLLVCRRFRRSGPSRACICSDLHIADSLDASIMLGRGIHLARATMGSIRYWPPAQYWVPPDGWVGSEFALTAMYTGDLP